jgi:hypothetical protein
VEKSGRIGIAAAAPAKDHSQVSIKAPATWRAHSMELWMAIPVGIFFLLLGGFFAAIGTSALLKAHVSENWPSVTATVLEVSDNSGGSKQVRFVFTAADQKTYETALNISGLRGSPKEIEVQYEPAKPTRTIYSRSNERAFGKVTASIGSVTALLGGWIIAYTILKLLRHRRENREFEARAAKREARRQRG